MWQRKVLSRLFLLQVHAVDLILYEDNVLRHLRPAAGETPFPEVPRKTGTVRYCEVLFALSQLDMYRA